MRQVIYLSRATRPLSGDELDRLAQGSRARNQEAGLTGCLVSWNGHFLQILEGEGGAVDRTFARIAQDPRHADLRVLVHGPIRARRFEGWSLESVRFDDPCPAIRRLLGRHPPLDAERSYYRDPMLAFALLYDVRFAMTGGVLQGG